MSETTKTLEDKLLNDADFKEKFEKELQRIADAKEAATPDEAVVKAAKSLLDLDIDLSELEKRRAMMEEMDPAELEQIAVGDSGPGCDKEYTCHIAWHHPDETTPDDKCWWNYGCFGVYRCQKAQN